ncbi:helix-turn-helix transcriptional regulator [Actinomyces graevenitzii]|uniref:helix-turn-helix transcriptional regulator n=1 Tax=Actinomyces graevenitzii TaxID=55565 RepID=UPI0015E0ABB8|nr:helix-turn-helix domain-containing protein [Actinomyces graevenitzii]
MRSSLNDIRSQISLLPAQRRVLEVVEGAGQPISSAEVAKTLKLHPNTAREHLDALLNAGLVTTLPMRTGKRGRPTLLYSVTTLDPNQILSTYLDVITATAISLAEGSDGVAQAIAVGKNWAGLTCPQPAQTGFQGTSGAVAPSAVSSAEAASAAAATSDAVAAEPSHLSETGANTAAEANMTQRLENAIAQLRPIFTVMGFAPELAKNKLVLHSCPFAKGGWPHPLVCIIHEAYIAELLTRSSGVRVVSSAELKLHPQLASTCLVELKRNKTTCSVGVCDCSQPTPHAASRH